MGLLSDISVFAPYMLSGWPKLLIIFVLIRKTYRDNSASPKGPQSANRRHDGGPRIVEKCKRWPAAFARDYDAPRL